MASEEKLEVRDDDDDLEETVENVVVHIQSETDEEVEEEVCGEVQPVDVPEDDVKTGDTQMDAGNESGGNGSEKFVDTSRVKNEADETSIRSLETKDVSKLKKFQFDNVMDIPSIDSPVSPPSSTGSDDEPGHRTVYSGVTFIGTATVNAPCSEVELNRVMNTMKKQGGEAIEVHLSIPLSHTGSITLFDAETNFPLSVHRIRHVLFCARGKDEGMKEYLSFTTGYRNAEIFHCHVFRCVEEESCYRILQSIGKAFRNPTKKETPPSTFESNEFDFDITVDILEEDSKGGFSSVTRDKDCFKVRQNLLKRIVVTIVQTSNKLLTVQRCFGILVCPGRNCKASSLHLLEMVSSGAVKDGKAYEVVGIWNCQQDEFAILNTETPKSSTLYLTVAVDFVLEHIKDSVRFVREVPVRVYKTTERFWLPTIMRQSNTETFHVTVKNDNESKETTDGLIQYIVSKLENVTLSQRRRTGSHGPFSALLNRVKDTDPASASDSDQEVDATEECEDDEPLMSGSGSVETAWTDDQIQSWSTMIGKWDGKSRSKQLVHLIRKGIPDMLRGQVWQMLTGASENQKLIEDFPVLLTKDTPNEQIISWDIDRTFTAHENFRGGKSDGGRDGGRDGLYKISKAYAIYDSEIGYCQGFSFLTAVLLLHMPEEQAFTVLVNIMFEYGLRELFKNNFEVLHLYFYQLDRLIEAEMPDLHNHFAELKIEPHMYASQWFLTIYTVKFPLPFVYRIMDIVLCEGLNMIFRVALALLKASRSQLLQLDFEGVLKHFRVALPKRYSSEKETNQIIAMAVNIKVDSKKLRKLEKEYQAMKEAEAAEEDPVARLERDNKRLQETNLRLEQENDTLAQELVVSKISLRQEMDKLEQRIDKLSKERRSAVEERDNAVKQSQQSQEEAVELRQLYQKTVLELEMERQHHQAEMAEYKQMCQQLDERNQQAQDDLKQELLEVKARMGNHVSDATGETEGDGNATSSTVVPSMLSSEQRLRELEMELAHYKLQLVESECRAGDLERKLKASSSPAASTKKGFLSKLKSFNS